MSWGRKCRLKEWVFAGRGVAGEVVRVPGMLGVIEMGRVSP